MSFSSVIKEELCRVAPQGICCVRAELASVYSINGAGGAPPDCLVTENAAFARRVFSLLRRLYKTPPDIIVRKNKKLKKNMSYIVKINSAAGFSGIAGDNRKPPAGLSGIAGESRKPAAASAVGANNLRRMIKKNCCKKAALRGAFLAGGSISDPEKLYHLEIYCKQYELARYFLGLMADFNLGPKIMERSEYCVAYVKDSERIVDFLNLTGAHSALMSLENTRILKDMRNSVNRAVNCETANLEKTVNASMRQIANIMFIKDAIGFDSLPKNLREIAILRESNREISLRELGQLAEPPLGKSGVNHRLRKLDLLAEEIRGMRERT